MLPSTYFKHHTILNQSFVQLNSKYWHLVYVDETDFMRIKISSCFGWRLCPYWMAFHLQFSYLLFGIHCCHTTYSTNDVKVSQVTLPMENNSIWRPQYSTIQYECCIYDFQYGFLLLNAHCSLLGGRHNCLHDVMLPTWHLSELFFFAANIVKS